MPDLPQPKTVSGLVCPHCRRGLEPFKTRVGYVWVCPEQHGRALNSSQLKRLSEAHFFRALWIELSKHPELRVGVACPSCRKSMRLVTTLGRSGAVEIDGCPTCHMLWLDAGEEAQLPEIPAPPELSPESRQAVARAQVEALSERRYQAEPFEDAVPDELWKTVVVYFGLPVEEDSSRCGHVPWSTIILAGLVLMVSIIALTARQTWIENLGFIAGDPWRLFGFTALSSFFLHAGWWHLLGNLYFLLTFGSRTEEVLGQGRQLALIGIAEMGAALLHVALTGSPGLPVIGASGGISGVLAFYALAQPERMLIVNLMPRLTYEPWLVRLPAWSGFIIWCLYQIVLAFLEREHLTNTAAFAHLGGAAAGVLFWFWWKRRNPLSATRSC